MASLLRAFCPAALLIAAGCIELQNALQPKEPSPPGDGSTPVEPDVPTDGDTPSEVPVVILTVSNPTPVVGEEVLLTCSLVGGDPSEVTFDFQPSSSRVVVNRQAGTARLIVDLSDAGTAFTFTCTATNQAGTSEPSNPQTIIATPPVEDDSEEP